MKTQVILACLLLATLSASAQTTTIQFRRDGDKLIVTQNGSDSTVNAADSNDFIVPVPDTSAPAPHPVTPEVKPATPTITPAPAAIKAPEPMKAVRPPKAPAAAPDQSAPSIIQSSSQPVGHGGGVIISPSTLPNDSLPSLPASDMTSMTAPAPTPLSALAKAPVPSPSETTLTLAERRELNMYRTMLASPLHLTIDNGAVTVKWNAAHGTVPIPDSHQIDIKLDRVIQTPTH